MKKQPKPKPQAIYKYWLVRSATGILAVRKTDAGLIGDEFISGPHTYDDACEIRYAIREREGN